MKIKIKKRTIRTAGNIIKKAFVWLVVYETVISFV